MPELPEVETIVRDLVVLKGQRFENITIYDDRVLVDRKQFARDLTNKTVKSVSRRGKAIVIELKESGFLIVHLKMTGQMILAHTDLRQSLKGNDTKVVFKLSNGKYLNYNDQRTFGKLAWVNSIEDFPFLKKLGPEPLSEEFSISLLSEKLKGKKAPIKTVLLNQECIAGIGNIYASEILFDARIRPEKSAGDLALNTIKRLHQSTQDILNKAINARGTSMRNYLDSKGEKGKFNALIQVYGRDNEPCFQCRSPIVKVVQAGRSTFYCEKCQK